MENLEGLDVFEAQKKIKNYLSDLYVSKPIEPRLKSLKIFPKILFPFFYKRKYLDKMRRADFLFFIILKILNA